MGRQSCYVVSHMKSRLHKTSFKLPESEKPVESGHWERKRARKVFSCPVESFEMTTICQQNLQKAFDVLCENCRRNL